MHELGHVVLYVTNVEKIADFYEDILGFPLIAKIQGMAAFSSGRTHHELLLIEVGGKPKPERVEPGLYHIGLKVGNSKEELKKVLQELHAANVEIVGMADHTVTNSVYIKDPDGNEIELYVDISDEWKKNPRAVIAPTKPLELD